MEPTGLELPRRFAWHEVWREVLLHPSEQAFVRILADPSASPKRAYTWVAVVALLGGVLQAVALRIAGVDSIGGSDIAILTIACGAIFSPVFAVIGLAVGAAIYHWIAGLFGGAGTYNRMAYAYAAISSPMSLVSFILTTITTPLSLAGTGNNSLLALCLAPFSLALGIYAIVLNVLAVKAVERLDTGKAVLTVLMPTIIIFVVFIACIFLVLVPLIMNQTGLLQ